MKLLVIEDEPKTAAYLQRGLCESGFLVDVAGNGGDGLFFAVSRAYEVIVLDVLLPQCDGWTVLRGLRDAGKTTPVLMLSACDTVSDRVKGLELGADDYLVKPFAFSELLARVRSLMRRGQHPDVLRLMDLEIDFARQRVTRAGRRVELTQREFTLLALLARHPGEILSRTLISEQVWNMNFDSGTNVVDVAIRRLRAKLDDPFEQKLVHSARGRGYVLEAR